MTYMATERDLEAARTEIKDLKDQIYRLKKQIAAASVANDHQVQDALRKSEDCATHGPEIHYLRHLAWSHQTQSDRVNSGARAMVHLLYDLANGIEQGHVISPLTAPKAIRKVLDFYVAARDRQPFPKCNVCVHGEAPGWPEKLPSGGSTHKQGALFDV